MTRSPVLARYAVLADCSNAWLQFWLLTKFMSTAAKVYLAVTGFI